MLTFRKRYRRARPALITRGSSPLKARTTGAATKSAPSGAILAWAVAAAVATLTVSGTVPDPASVAGLGFTLQLAPVGAPVQVKVTFPLKPSATTETL
jgi:hypothetical protein